MVRFAPLISRSVLRQKAARGHELERAFAVLSRHVSPGVASFIDRLRSPRLRWARIPIGLLLILSSALWFLPVLGVEFLPLGLLIIAIDVPVLRGPAGRLVLCLEYWALLAVRRWRNWRRRRRLPGADAAS